MHSLKGNYDFCLELRVRDYECDLQGIVNNANYQHYLEHARHEYLVSKGISFSDLHDAGLDLIVVRVEIDYKYPLRSRDTFMVCLNVKRKGNVRIVFEQDIFRLPDLRHIVHGIVTGAGMRNGRPVSPEEVISRLGLE
ncbi:MAG: acyl-CoA thioesterase [Bacteroidales bacterium]|nr:acyl-CoA thioesterase [Bacteroidales bacterium]